jgi:hypothetical protein
MPQQLFSFALLYPLTFSAAISAATTQNVPVPPKLTTQVSANTAPGSQADSSEVMQILGRTPQGLQLSTSKILKLAGTGSDPLRALEALPGVTLATPSSGGPVARPAVRGSSPLDNDYQTDFLPVGYVFHNDGLSTFNPLLINSFSLQSSSWGPQYRDATGAVILTSLKDPDPGQSQTLLDLGAIRSALLYEGPLNEQAAFYVSVRQSFIHLYVDNFIEDEEFDFAIPPRNNDYQSKLRWELSQDEALILTATGASDKVRRRFDAGSRDVGKNPDLASGEGFQSEYQQLGAVWQLSHSLGASQLAVNYLTHSEDITQGISFTQQSQLDEWLFKAATDTDFDAGVLQWGGELKQQQLDLQLSGRSQPCNLETASCPPALYAPLLQDQLAKSVRFSGAFANWQQQLDSNWQYQAGLALDQNNFTEQSFVEPRLELSYQADALNSANSPEAGAAWQHWQLKLAYGQHHQWFRRPELLSAVFGNPQLELEEAEQIGLAFSQPLSPGWSWQLELYQKKLSGLFVANPARQHSGASNQPSLVATVPAFVNGGSGTVRGAELLLNRDLSDGWYGWFSLSYSHNQRHNDLLAQDFNYEWDIPLQLNAVLQYQWHEQWQLGLKWRYQSGRRFTEIYGSRPVFPTRQGRPDPSLPALFYHPIEGEFNGARRDAMHRLDLRLDYQTQWGPYPVSLYAEVLNIYANKTVQEQEWNADYSHYELDYEFPDFPFPGLGLIIRF